MLKTTEILISIQHKNRPIFIGVLLWQCSQKNMQVSYIFSSCFAAVYHIILNKFFYTLFFEIDKSDILLLLMSLLRTSKNAVFPAPLIALTPT